MNSAERVISALRGECSAAAAPGGGFILS